MKARSRSAGHFHWVTASHCSAPPVDKRFHPEETERKTGADIKQHFSTFQCEMIVRKHYGLFGLSSLIPSKIDRVEFAWTACMSLFVPHKAFMAPVEDITFPRSRARRPRHGCDKWSGRTMGFLWSENQIPVSLVIRLILSTLNAHDKSAYFLPDLETKINAVSLWR